MTEPPSPQSGSAQDILRQTEAAEALRRVRIESEAIGRSAFSRQEPVAVAADDKIELWGKRIGRMLGAVVVVYLVWQLTNTLLSGH